MIFATGSSEPLAQWSNSLRPANSPVFHKSAPRALTASQTI
jgi:hypothetical protein